MIRKERKSVENREGETVTLINIEAVFEANKSFHNQFCHRHVRLCVCMCVCEQRCKKGKSSKERKKKQYKHKKL